MAVQGRRRNVCHNIVLVHDPVVIRRICRAENLVRRRRAGSQTCTVSVAAPLDHGRRGKRLSPELRPDYAP